MVKDDPTHVTRLPDTSKLGELPDHLTRKTITRDLDDVSSALLSEDGCVSLFVSGLREKLCFDKSPIITLGRLNELFHVEGLVDLSPYRATERGVSRIHCQLSLKDNQVYITDLGSTNGTYLNGRRLEPNQPTLITKRNTVSLARLPIKLLTQ